MTDPSFKAKRIKIALSRLSAAKGRLLVTLRRAVSMLCKALKPDWNFSKMLLWDIKHKNCIEITFSKTLDKNGSLEIGLKLLRTEGSRFGFFKRGWTTVCECGKMTLFRELLMINKILGPTVSITSLRNLVGIKSGLQVVSFMCGTM